MVTTSVPDYPDGSLPARERSSIGPRQDLSFLWLEITAKCNLECLHCYADSSPRQNLLGEMSTEEWLKIIRDSVRLGCRHVQFIGGEPTLHPDLARMIPFASDQGHTFIEVFTNATNIDDRLLKIFVEYGVHVATSFYSDDEETHEGITKRRGSFRRTVENLKRMLAAGLPVRAGIIETRANIGHAEKAGFFLKNLGVAEIRVDSQRGVGRGSGSDVAAEPMSQLCGECWKGKLCVTSSSRTYPCVFSRFVDLGDAKAGIDAILASDPLAMFRSGLKRYRKEQEALRKNNPRAEVDSGTNTQCSPKCSPCGPDAFPVREKCIPKLEHLFVRNRDAVGRLASAAAGAVETSISTPFTCAPKTCSPCSPGDFRCVPRAQPCL